MNTSIELTNNIISILSKNDNVKNRYREDIEWLESRKDKWNKNKIRVGIIGITSSGKSTLINAIIGKKILSTAVVPNSSSMTSCFYNDKEKLIIYFKDSSKKEFNNVSPENIIKYNDERYNQNNKNQVEFLEIYTPYFSLDKDIELIDSPGLEAYGLEYHEELTLDTLLPTIDICIYVTTLKTNSDDKTREIINKIASRNIPLVIVQNMLDSVKASIDGRKSEDEVALESKNRLIRIINNSNISNKHEVIICQLSAILILDKKIEQKDIDKKYEHKFDEFTASVNKLVNEKKPTIDKERINSIISKFDLLIDDEKKRLININYNIKFQYEGYDSKIDNEKEQLINNIENLFKAFSYDTLNNSNNAVNKPNNSYSGLWGGIFNALSEIANINLNSGNIEDKVKKTKEMAHNFEKGITESIKKYYDFLIQTSKELNIPFRDISFSHVNVEQYNLEVQKDKEVKTERVKKSGVGGFLGRAFGKVAGIFVDNDWGYEEKKETYLKINEKATEAKIKEYIEKIKSVYSTTIKEYYKQFDFMTDQFYLAIDKEKRSFEDKQKNLLNEKEVKNLIEELDRLLDNYRKVKHNNVSNNKHKKEENNTETDDLEEINIEDYLYNFVTLSEHIIYKFNNEIMISLFNHLQIHNANELIIGWDNQSISLFMKRFFNKIAEVNDNMKNKTSNILKDSSFSLNVLYSPNNTNFNLNSYNNIYLMINAQIGLQEKQIKDIKLFDKLTNSHSLFLVIEDFEQLIKANSFKEMLLKLLELKEQIQEIHHCKTFILINSENPIYNLSFIEYQLNPCKNVNDEVRLIKSIEDEYYHFINDNVKNHIANILKVKNNK